MSFQRADDPLVQGKRQLLYYIGQGRRGTTYLFAVDGFYFETPINLYTAKRMWDMAPAYGDAHEIPMNLPALPSCMDCHVSGIRPPIEGTENRYASPLFLYAGVTCERCHGAGSNHVVGGAAVNPVKLTPERRDQVCMQCHLEGNAAIERPGKHLYQFRPGDDLSDYVRYYVLSDNGKPGLRAASQFEQLAQSVCKQKSGDAMSCTSCHDPRRSIPADQKVSFIVRSAWPVTERILEPSTTTTSPIARSVICRQTQARTLRTLRSRTTASRGAPRWGLGLNSQRQARRPSRDWRRFHLPKALTTMCETWR